LFKDQLFKDKVLDTRCRVTGDDLYHLKSCLESGNQEHAIEDVIIVNASVKIIKLYFDGIPIDISFNQIGGICAFNYLERIDEITGKDHLFKKAILIIKAW